MTAMTRTLNTTCTASPHRAFNPVLVRRPTLPTRSPSLVQVSFVLPGIILHIMTVVCYRWAMLDQSRRPLVGVSASRMFMHAHSLPHHASGERYIRAVSEGAGAIPLIIPAFPEAHDAEDLAGRLDGLFLTGGRANVEPHHYGGPCFPEDEIRDPPRDNTVLPLIRECVRLGIPVFGSCRGIQEINVALGGTLHYRTHLVPGYDDHRMLRDGDMEHRMGPRHAVHLTEDGLFHKLLGKKETLVNSLHGQSIDRLAPDLELECVSPDGVIEGISHSGSQALCIGVQWHSEWRYDQHELDQKLWRAFGDACRLRAASRVGAAAVVG